MGERKKKGRALNSGNLDSEVASKGTRVCQTGTCDRRAVQYPDVQHKTHNHQQSVRSVLSLCTACGVHSEETQEIRGGAIDQDIDIDTDLDR